MKIVNNTKDFIPNCTKSELSVIDSKSSYYKTSLSDQWNTRIYKEYLDCMKCGGKVIFSTFTYNDISVPRFYWYDDEGNEHSFMCFSKRHKDRFLNSLRKRWEDFGVTGKSCEYPFKYIWCNEYGEYELGTHRPHYHVLFFVPKEILQLEGTEEQHWKDLLQSYWTVPRSNQLLGKVRWCPGSSIFVNSEFASLYCSKYMFKDDSFLLNEDVKLYFDTFGELPSNGKRKGSFTSHWQSFHFGESLVNDYNKPDVFVEGLDLHLPSEVIKGRSVKHRIPKYVERKLTMDYDYENLRYIINERGVELLQHRFKSQVSNGVFRYRSKFCNIDWLRSNITEEEFRNNKILSKFGDLESLITYLHNVDSCNPGRLEDIVLYKKVWRGLVCGKDIITKLYNCVGEDFVKLSYQRFLEIIRKDLDFPFSKYHCELGVFKGQWIHGELLQQDSFGVVVPVLQQDYYPVDDLERFYGFNVFLDCCDEINTIISERNYKKYLENKDRRRKLKFMIKKIS